MENKHICILFGAGADAPFKIGTGGSFAEAVLGLNETDLRITNAIESHYKRLQKNDDWYPSYINHRWGKNDLLKAALRRRNLENNKKISDDDFKKELDELSSDEQKREDIINEFPSYMGLIDKKFSTLIAPSILGSGNFWQVVSCYCRAYLTIVEQILGKPDYEYYLRPDKTLIDKMGAAIDLKTGCDKYYSIIKKYRDSVKISVVTTNYTPFCEKLSGLCKDEIAYVHGRIGLFESPKNLCVYDIEKDPIPDEILIPYIFIQSGVKPIVERTQIEEYSKMVHFFDDADKIVILGYKLNSDDNHLNSIIRSAVKQNKEVVYLSYNDCGSAFLSREQVLKRLRLSDDFPMLVYHEIDSSNAVRIFENEFVK